MRDNDTGKDGYKEVNGVDEGAQHAFPCRHAFPRLLTCRVIFVKTFPYSTTTDDDQRPQLWVGSAQINQRVIRLLVRIVRGVGTVVTRTSNAWTPQMF